MHGSLARSSFCYLDISVHLSSSRSANSYNKAPGLFLKRACFLETIISVIKMGMKSSDQDTLHIIIA